MGSAACSFCPGLAPAAATHRHLVDASGAAWLSTGLNSLPVSGKLTNSFFIQKTHKMKFTLLCKTEIG